MALKKSDIKPPVLPKETVDVPELGGEVVVRGLLLRDRIAYALDKTGDMGRFSRFLAASIYTGDGFPVYTAEEWEEFGSRNLDACLRLFQVARRLSGMDTEEAQKN